MSERLVDSFARGELSSAESRELAQQALGDQDLFDELTSTSIATRGLATARRKQTRWPRIAMFAAAAAAIVGIALFLPRRSSEPIMPAVAVAAPPTLLARSGESNAPTFRGADTESREPRATGSIMSIAGGVATIDLGSLDGLTKDAELDVIQDGQTIGHIKLTTVFRDHSRGTITSGGSLRLNGEIHVPPSLRLRAILDQIEGLLARGKTEKAISIAQLASIDSFDAELTREEDLNNAGVIAELHGNRAEARELYRRALEANPSAPNRQAIDNNLARLKDAR